MNIDTEDDGLRKFTQELLRAWHIPANTGNRVHYLRAKALLSGMDFDRGQYKDALEIVREWINVDEP